MPQLAPPRENLQSGLILSLGVALIALISYSIPAFLDRPMVENPEARIVVVAREMIRSGNYVIPTLGGEPRLMKPPLPYWTTAVGLKLSGAGVDPSPREMTMGLLLPMALIKALGVLAVALFGCAVFGRTGGIMAGAILATCYMLNQGARLGFADCILMSTSAWMLCAATWLVAHPRPGFFAAAALGIGLGLGILVKEPVPFMVLGGGVAAEIVLRRKWDTRKATLWGMGLLLAGIIVIPWFVMVEQERPGSIVAMIKERLGIWNLADAVDDGHVQDDGSIYYFYKLAGGLLPWIALLIPAVFLVWGQLKDERAKFRDASTPEGLALASARFLLLVLVFGFMAFYLNRKQQDHYLWPLLPAAALLGGYVLSYVVRPGGIAEEGLAWLILGGGALSGVVLASFPVWAKMLPAPKSAGVFSAVDLAEQGWVVSVPAGVGLVLLGAVLARWVVNGRMLLAGLAMMFTAAIGWTVAGGVIIRNDLRNHDLLKEWKALRKELNPQNETMVYAANHAPAIWMYYLGRPVKPITDIPRLDPAIPAEKIVSPILVGRLPDFKTMDLKPLGWSLPEPLPEPSTERTWVVIALKPLEKSIEKTASDTKP